MPVILGIESSCDETAAAVIDNGKLLANIVAGQEVHRQWGGVIPELASRAHQQHIVPVIDKTLKTAGKLPAEIDAVAFTRGPGLLGSLLVGTSFAKGFALALGKPLIEVNHMRAHILAHFIEDEHPRAKPSFPFLCLTVSGGHTQIVKISDPYTFNILGETIDDAAGEAFDKTAKILGLPYPGGPLIDQHAANGDPLAFHFPSSNVGDYNFSFSGMKTAVLYFVRDELKKDEMFLQKRMDDLCASVQHTIVTALMKKLEKAAGDTGIRDIALAGGVSANSGLRKKLEETGKAKGWNVFIPPFSYCTDNAAMIAMAGHFKFLRHEFSGQDVAPLARYPV
ncbi:MAG TPA: tRNA (adenosine(37)-N6)-threonylcarbamoyltransferase complex transferase subunit TsaD [Bacteroidia bacterium]|nr:tRNA (adenosine(37)-N6)-threonylcarbamoyltransferase complex transferase subunit TsaD [Bacteroidia bacterium]